jgi:hypothetical protein
MQILMKCADVANPTKEWPIYQEWISRITTEFYNQGDRERALNLPISPFMNRESTGSTTSSQTGFIQYVVYPLFEALDSWIPLNEIKATLDANKALFEVAVQPKPEEPKHKRVQQLSLRLDGLISTSVEGSRSAGDTVSTLPYSQRKAALVPRRASIAAGIRNLTFFRNPSSGKADAIEES